MKDAACRTSIFGRLLEAVISLRLSNFVQPAKGAAPPGGGG